MLSGTLESNDIINLEETMKILSCDQETAVKMLKMLFDTIQGDKVRLEIAYKNNDIQTTQEILHTLEGCLCYCKAPKLNQVIIELHEQTKHINKLSSLRAIYDQLYQEIDNFVEEYYQIIAK